MNTDILIIGGGPSGVEAALTASVYSNNVTLVSNESVGDWKSGYTNIFLENIEEIKKKGSFSLEQFKTIYNDWVEQQKELLLNAGVQLVTGFASFVNEKSVKVIGHKDQEMIIHSNKIIIATGSHPIFPDKIKPDGKYIFSYETIKNLEEIPSSIIVIGDSPIGYEMVNLFMQLGLSVTWLLPENQNPLLDKDIIEYMHSFYKDNGVQIVSGPWVDKVYSNNGSVKVIREDSKTFEADSVFVTLGFRPNLNSLKLENTNLELNPYHSLDCNEYGQTLNESIYITGDALLPVSYTAIHGIARARVVALHAAGKKTDPIDIHTLPLCFNENPQIGAVGQFNTVGKDINFKKIPYQTRHFKAFMTNKREGFLKIVWDRDGIIVGASCVGHQAKEVIATIALIIKLNVSINQAASFVSVHPSASELPFIALQNYIKSI
ncbi:FAD-dependent oxidoreductase [Ornithinibacillus scapharcae]|uniref:FAD-dependent oxidoreductase n=1 Tax=Ornithinibacillus scapharcae TaxID=1147159 RepID=UPI000225B2F5|nr:NAD(P)/FAD-dependent oxidoreductase [Ornithinibacillus scapharcae]